MQHPVLRIAVWTLAFPKCQYKNDNLGDSYSLEQFETKYDLLQG